MKRGIPFELKLPELKPIALGGLTDAEFNEIMERGIAQYAAGQVTSSKDVINQMRKEFGV